MSRKFERGFSLIEISIALTILLLILIPVSISYFSSIERVKDKKVLKEADIIRLVLLEEGVDVSNYSTPFDYGDLDPKVRDILEYNFDLGVDLDKFVFNNTPVIDGDTYSLGSLTMPYTLEIALSDSLSKNKVLADELISDMDIRKLDNNKMKKLFQKDFVGDWFIVDIVNDNDEQVGNEEGNHEDKYGYYMSELEALDKGYKLVKTADDLRSMNNNLNGKYILMDDIDLRSIGNWIPIGLGKKQKLFNGELNGNGYSINNLYINSNNSSYVGLFSQLGDAKIHNIEFNNVYIKGKHYTGVLAGKIEGSSEIYDVSINGDIAGNNYIGSISGIATENINIKNVSISANIVGKTRVGGMVGSTLKGIDVKNSSYSGTVEGNVFVGGLFGSAYGNKNNLSIIDNSYFKGTLKAKNKYGELIGEYDKYLIILNIK